MNRKCLFNLFFVLSSFVTIAQSNDEMIVRNLMDEQAKAWNAGNIESYMQAYWQSDSLEFISKNGITYGWKNTLDNYKKAYPDTTSMGKVHFDIIEIKRLSVLYFHVVGKWHLTRSIGNVGGYFTLLFKKVKGKWVIVSDHSS